LVQTSNGVDEPAPLLTAVETVNDTQKSILLDKLNQHFNGDLNGKIIALWGLAFKPNTDDMRDSPAIAVAQTLTDAGVQVSAYDPEGMELAQPLMPDVAMCDDPYSAIEGADATVIVTEWDAFRALDLDRVKDLANAPVLVDLRNIYAPDDVRARGFSYASIGRA